MHLLPKHRVAWFLFWVLILWTGERTILNCERSRNTCELVRTGLGWSKTQQFSLQELQGAYIQVVTIGENIEPKGVTLLTSQGDINMTDAPYFSLLHDETSRQINFFVQHPGRASLQVYEDNRWLLILVGIWISIGIIF